MKFALVVTRETETGNSLRDALAARGWWGTVVADREKALRSAAEQAPQLVFIDQQVEEASLLIEDFHAAGGGPGAVLLAPADAADDGDAGGDSKHGRNGNNEYGADAVLSASPDPDELWATADELLARKDGEPENVDSTVGRVMNSSEIFGEVLREVGSESELDAPPQDAGESEEKAQSEDEVPAELVLSEILPAVPETEDERDTEAAASEQEPPDLSDVPFPAVAAAGHTGVPTLPTGETVRIPLEETTPFAPMPEIDTAATAVVPAESPKEAGDSARGRTTRFSLRSLQSLPSPPGGYRLWLAIAAGVAVFLLTSALLNRFFGDPSAPAERKAPADVSAPASPERSAAGD